ncbi:hypothetical protein [Pseudonocardia sp. TMWB2A]|uniref:hypothetical protein n=1 Tax=Pseudonocardia sp. TMWB2A TaxID=687430 RepID=UPI00307CE089
MDAVAALTERTEAAERSIAALAKRTDALEARTTVWTGHFTQETTVQVAVGGTRDIPITWATPAPSTTYSAAAAVSVAAALLGKVTATVKQGSKTKTGCVVTVQNSGLVTLAIGAEVSVIAVG